MLHKETCLRCYINSNPDWKKVFTEEQFEQHWKQGWVQCNGGKPEGHRGWSYNHEAPPEWCLYILEQTVSKTC